MYFEISKLGEWQVYHSFRVPSFDAAKEYLEEFRKTNQFEVNICCYFKENWLVLNFENQKFISATNKEGALPLSLSDALSFLTKGKYRLRVSSYKKAVFVSYEITDNRTENWMPFYELTGFYNRGLTPGEAC